MSKRVTAFYARKKENIISPTRPVISSDISNWIWTLDLKNPTSITQPSGPSFLHHTSETFSLLGKFSFLALHDYPPFWPKSQNKQQTQFINHRWKLLLVQVGSFSLSLSLSLSLLPVRIITRTHALKRLLSHTSLLHYSLTFQPHQHTNAQTRTHAHTASLYVSGSLMRALANNKNPHHQLCHQEKINCPSKCFQPIARKTCGLYYKIFCFFCEL